jgi:hypothetical protein
MDDPRRRRLLLAAAATAVVVLTLVRGPVVLAAASAVVLAVFAYRLAGTVRPSRPDWAWGERARTPADEGRLGALAGILDTDGRDPDSPARLQRWFRDVAGARRHAGAQGPEAARLDSYLTGPPRRLTPAEVDQLLTDLDQS